MAPASSSKCFIKSLSSLPRFPCRAAAAEAEANVTHYQAGGYLFHFLLLSLISVFIINISIVVVIVVVTFIAPLAASDPARCAQTGPVQSPHSRGAPDRNRRIAKCAAAIAPLSRSRNSQWRFYGAYRPARRQARVVRRKSRKPRFAECSICVGAHSDAKTGNHFSLNALVMSQNALTTAAHPRHS